MAAAAGLPLMEGRLCAEGATTYGVGELILAAIRDGARRIILGLGGSATNDGGCGCAAALGVRFLSGSFPQGFGGFGACGSTCPIAPPC